MNERRWRRATAAAWPRWSWRWTWFSKRSAPLRALFQRACELGVLVGGANRTTHLFGRRINRHYHGKLQTVLDQRDVTPSAALVYQTSFAKQYVRGDQHSDRILRNETCSTTPVLRRWASPRKPPAAARQTGRTNKRCLANRLSCWPVRSILANSPHWRFQHWSDQRRIPGLKLHDDRGVA